MEFVTPDGEVLELEKSPYQIACTQLVAFKLSTIETVNADPRLSKAPCLAAMVVYLSFLKINKETLKPGAVYASNLKLMAKGGIRTKVTAGAARKLLVREGYLVPANTKTKDGCVKFYIANPHLDRVKMHVTEAEEYYGRRDAERKEDDRRKRAVKPEGVIVTDTPSKPRGDSNYTDRVIVTDTKYLRGNLRDSLHEGGSNREEGEVASSVNPYAYAADCDDPHRTLPIPHDQDEANRMMDEICFGRSVSDTIRSYMTRMLLDGTLSFSLIDRLTLPKADEEAAA